MIGRLLERWSTHLVKMSGAASLEGLWQDKTVWLAGRVEWRRGNAKGA